MAEQYIYYFEKLQVWKDSRSLVKMVYDVSRTFPTFEKQGLASQIQRAVVSVSSNIAEGMSRSSEKEQLHFLEIAYSSLMEVLCQLNLAFDLAYIDEKTLNDVRVLLNTTSKELTALVRTIKQRYSNS